MTNQEAIKWIDGRVLELAYIVDNPISGREMQRINKEYNALLQARGALQHRIPEKPEIKETEKPFAKFGKSGILKRTTYLCPVCGQPLYVQNHFEFKSEDGEGFER